MLCLPVRGTRAPRAELKEAPEALPPPRISPEGDAMEKKRKTSDEATTRSPADSDIFGDEGATRPAKDEDHPRVDERPETSEAGGVD
jgi:hypothetical protein